MSLLRGKTKTNRLRIATMHQLLYSIPTLKMKTMTEIQRNFTRLVEEATGHQCVCELLFHPSRKWRFDYAIPAAQVAIEVEGGIYTNGRHIRGKGFEADMEKYNTAESMGWHVLRITPEWLCAPKTIELIKRTCSHCSYPI